MVAKLRRKSDDMNNMLFAINTIAYDAAHIHIYIYTYVICICLPNLHAFAVRKVRTCHVPVLAFVHVGKQLKITCS